MKEKRREGRKKERRKGKREGKGEDYIFQFHQKEVKIDKLRNNIINLLLRNMEGNYQEWLKVIKNKIKIN